MLISLAGVGGYTQPASVLIQAAVDTLFRQQLDDYRRRPCQLLSTLIFGNLLA